MRNEQMYLEGCSEMNNKTQMIYKIVCEGEEHDLQMRTTEHENIQTRIILIHIISSQQLYYHQ